MNHQRGKVLANPATGLAPQRDDVDPAAEVGRAFKHSMAALRRLRRRETRSPGELSDAQYGLLFCLRSGAMACSELAVAADLSPASVTEMLDGLAATGLVERFRSDRDRRVVMSALTEVGRTLVEERRARIEPRFKAALSGFHGEQLLVAAAVLDRLGAFFDELSDERHRQGLGPDREQPL